MTVVVVREIFAGLGQERPSEPQVVGTMHLGEAWSAPFVSCSSQG